MSTPFLTRQSPLPTTLNQRPIVPMIYTMVPFQQYGGCWEKMKMKDTQTETEPQQAENVNEEQDMNSEENRDDVGRVTGVATNMFKLSEGEDHNAYKDEHRVVYLEQYPDHDEMLKSGSILEMNLGEEKKGYAAFSQNSPPPNAVKDRAEIQNTLNSKSYQSTGDLNKLQQEPVCASLEAGEGIQPKEGPKQMPVELEDFPQQIPTGGDSHSLYEGCHYSSAPPTLYPVEKSIQCDMTEGAEQMGSGNQDEDEDDGVERNSCEGHSPSLTRLSQSNKVDEGIQCDMSWYEAQLEKSPQQMPSRGEETSPGCKTKGSWEKTVTNRKLSADKGEKIMNDEMGEVYNENFKRCAKTKKTVRGRKLKDLSSFSNVKTAYLLKKSAALNIVLPEDSEDSEWEEEVEDEMEEIECLLEVSPQGPLTSFKGRFYQDPGRIIWMPPESSVCPQLIVWPTGNKYKLKYGEHERIPVVYKVKGQDGCDSIGGRLRGKHTMAKQEGLESKRPSHKSLECKCLVGSYPIWLSVLAQYWVLGIERQLWINSVFPF
ncbi:hypothetical protein Cadr_000008165 [Camelus dromedarius]|uniref:Uncharacterized protein n=1 Tax=Camelus dromedarius TaxID=9838 RepID=A0A5N4DZ89_CAMDR|nr:hypothetical protein Cadr_000008165 [Camelus dromedarius]